MTAFIIFLLFLLNLITILAIIVLYLRQNKLIKLEQTQKSTLKEIDDTLSAYLLEMKEENEQLLIKIVGKSAVIKAKQRELVSERNREKSRLHQKYENDEKANNKPLNLKEIDDTLSALLEMKEENEQLLIKIAEQSAVKKAKQRESVSEENQEKSSSHKKYGNDEEANNKPLNRVKQKAVAAYKAPLEETDVLPDLMMINQDKLELTSDNQIESTTIKKAQKQSDFKEALHEQLSSSRSHKSKTISDEVIEFYQNGYSIEEIAKKLSKGKTEVELIVKLNKKKEK